MIENIEKLRKLHKVTKLELCKECGISAQMYGKYLKGSQLSADHAKKMIEYMGYQLAIIKLC